MRGVVPTHLRARFDVLNALAPTTAAPEPWRQIAVFAIGGLTDVGFGDSSDLLLATSQAGRGVFDCRNGSIVARDDGVFDFDVGNLMAEGIGPLIQQRVRVSGIHGGGLSCVTADGWKIERHPLFGGFSSESRAFGFSPTGRSLVLATAADICVFGR